MSARADGARADTLEADSSNLAPIARSLPARHFVPLSGDDCDRGPHTAASSRHHHTLSAISGRFSRLERDETRDSLDNWHALRDFDEEEDPWMQPGPSRRPSAAQAWNIPGKDSKWVGVGQIGINSPSVAKVLSSSPPRMDNGFGRSIEDVLDDIEESHETVHNPPRDASQVPLLRKESSKPVLRQRYIDKIWPLSPVVVAVLKCAIAYTLASLFTFVPALSALLSTSSETDAHGRVTRRPNYSAHMVATIVVYYNPAKTIGGMFLATRYCIILAAFATFVCLGSMATLWLFDQFSPSHGTAWDWISEAGDWTVCIFWIGGSMGAIAWSRVWVGNPSYNTGCSMAAITIYTVVIKEGLIPKLLEVLAIVFFAACITNLTCFLLFPVSATSRLQTSISKSLTSFSTLLDRLCATFLLERTVVKDSHTTLRDAVTSHAAAFKKLKADLSEAKHERIVDPRIRGRHLELYDAAIESLARLAQHLAGLRGSTKLQEGLLKASREGRIRLDLVLDSRTMPSISPSVVETVGAVAGREALDDVEVATSLKLLVQFQDIAGKQMTELVSRCDDALEAVQSVTRRSSIDDPALPEIRRNLAESLHSFTRSSSRAIKRLYAGPRREKGMLGDRHEDSSDDDTPIDSGELLEGPNETVFMIYFFLFTFEEFARELIFLIETVSEILEADNITMVDYIKSLWPSRRGRSERRGTYLYKQFRKVVPVDPSNLQPPLFPLVKPDAQPTRSITYTLYERLRNRLWATGEFLRQPSLRYAIKTGLGGAILAAPAYVEIGRPIFLEYRGEWALIAYFSAMSPTVGATNLVSVFRVIGTLIGAFVAVLVYTLFPGHAIILPVLGTLLSLPAFYVITQIPEYAQAGRFTLLAYNLTCLYAFNSRERDISALSIALHRSTSVIAGVVWAAVVSRYWWPYTARRELRIGLSDFFLDLSYLYSKLVTTYSRGSQPDQPMTSNSVTEQAPLLPTTTDAYSHLGPGVKQFMSMELHLQGQLQSLRSLLSETKNEPRLKGPFAYDFYKEALLSCERMLDRLHSMRCVTTREEWDNGIREAFVIPVNPQRREMVGNVILYFYTLSAGFQLRTAMPPYLPPAEEARQRLVQAIRGLDVVRRRSVRGGGRHLLYFAYASAMQEVIAELEYLGKMMQDSFGVISQSTVGDFEALFQPSPLPSPS